MREIVSGIRMNERVYREGDEDALAQLLSQEELDRLVELEALSGDWKAKTKAKPESEPATNPALQDDVFAEYREAWGAKVVSALLDAGYDSREAIGAATDSQLVALPTIGHATVKRIRESLQEG